MRQLKFSECFRFIPATEENFNEWVVAAVSLKTAENRFKIKYVYITVSNFERALIVLPLEDGTCEPIHALLNFTSVDILEGFMSKKILLPTCDSEHAVVELAYSVLEAMRTFSRPTVICPYPDVEHTIALPDVETREVTIREMFTGDDIHKLRHTDIIFFHRSKFWIRDRNGDSELTLNEDINPKYVQAIESHINDAIKNDSSLHIPVRISDQRAYAQAVTRIHKFNYHVDLFKKNIIAIKKGLIRVRFMYLTLK
jgi:hypothetical protein